jgi:hypothetical protein
MGVFLRGGDFLGDLEVLRRRAGVAFLGDLDALLEVLRRRDALLEWLRLAGDLFAIFLVSSLRIGDLAPTDFIRDSRVAT